MVSRDSSEFEIAVVIEPSVFEPLKFFRNKIFERNIILYTSLLPEDLWDILRYLEGLNVLREQLPSRHFVPLDTSFPLKK